MKKYDFFGLGSPMVDAIAKVDYAFVRRLPYRHGHHSVTDVELSDLLSKIGANNVTYVPGDSTSNTMVALSQLKCKTLLCGRAGQDEFGGLFHDSLKEAGVGSRLVLSNEKTGCVIALVTPDAERRFVIHLGASNNLLTEEVPLDDIAASKYFHVTAYQLDQSPLRDTALDSIEYAREHGCIISLDLADPTFVKRNLDHLRRIVRQHVDVLFVNEEEAAAFTKKAGYEEQLHALSTYAPTAVLKLGAKGSMIHHDGRIYQVSAVKTKVVDTTGAGDSYAAGILYGLLRGMPMDKAGALASSIAGQVVSQVGPRLRRIKIPAPLARYMK